MTATRTVIRTKFHHVNLKTTRLQEMIDGNHVELQRYGPGGKAQVDIPEVSA